MVTRRAQAGAAFGVGGRQPNADAHLLSNQTFHSGTAVANAPR